MLDPKHKTNLLMLAEKLDAVLPENFYYGSWVGNNWEGAQDLSCGTTGCALGWAATMPFFREQGLRLYRPRDEPGVPLLERHIEAIEAYHARLGPEEELETWAAVGQAILELFGGDRYGVRGGKYREAYELFFPSLDYPDDATAQDVALRIRKYVEKFDQ